ncbi:hypothetical protein ElyMa_005027000 [Elysia marginata]|uniref:Uncharacterized protein n=1 Tax=Elysia marginata TaxID=1093978 RepID=A0AAV4J8X2_9GAST|nr:hypothetical protein ElyMa_005027000 [Elysia marginata]
MRYNNKNGKLNFVWPRASVVQWFTHRARDLAFASSIPNHDLRNLCYKTQRQTGKEKLTAVFVSGGQTKSGRSRNTGKSEHKVSREAARRREKPRDELSTRKRNNDIVDSTNI